MEQDTPLWVNALGYLMAFGFLGLGLWMLTKTRRFMSNAQSVSATVMESGETRTHTDGGAQTTLSSCL